MELTEAKLLATRLMSIFELDKWEFEWMNAKRTYGRCCYAQHSVVGQVAEYGTIKLSRDYVRAADRSLVEDTIRHEIAHALCSVGTGHGSAWKRMAVKCGAAPVRCSSVKGMGILSPFTAVCDKCPYQFKVFRRSKAMVRGNLYHKPCGPTSKLTCKKVS